MGSLWANLEANNHQKWGEHPGKCLAEPVVLRAGDVAARREVIYEILGVGTTHQVRDALVIKINRIFEPAFLAGAFVGGLVGRELVRARYCERRAPM